MGSRDKEILHSILVVSCSEQFNMDFRQMLPGNLFVSLEFRKNITQARRQILERWYDIVVINIPLPDENGLDLAMDIAEKGRASVLIAAPSEIYEMVLDYVTDYGILAIPKPSSKNRIEKALRYLMKVQEKLAGMQKELELARKRLEEMRLVNKAKFLLVEQKHMTEEEAHRHIGKLAMDQRISRQKAAEEVIEDFESL